MFTPQKTIWILLRFAPVTPHVQWHACWCVSDLDDGSAKRDDAGRGRVEIEKFEKRKTIQYDVWWRRCSINAYLQKKVSVKTGVNLKKGHLIYKANCTYYNDVVSLCPWDLTFDFDLILQGNKVRKGTIVSVSIILVCVVACKHLDITFVLPQSSNTTYLPTTYYHWRSK